ncbi:hypothetical protein YC2023_025051 [Brassica napus]
MVLEIYDFPLRMKAHSIWHLATIPLTVLWWSFIRNNAEFRTSSLLKKSKTEAKKVYLQMQRFLELFSIVNKAQPQKMKFILDLGGDWFSRYHPQTQLLRLVAIVGGLQQSLKSLYASNRSESHKLKSWLQLAFAGSLLQLRLFYYHSTTTRINKCLLKYRRHRKQSYVLVAALGLWHDVTNVYYSMRSP